MSPPTGRVMGRARAAAKATLGRRAESLAADHLTALGYEIVGRNVRVPGGELDLIARRGRLVVFCEVRARSRDSAIAPVDTLTAAKQARVRAAARRWLSRHGRGFTEVRFDAAAVVFDTPGGRMTYFEGAF